MATKEPVGIVHGSQLGLEAWIGAFFTTLLSIMIGIPVVGIVLWSPLVFKSTGIDWYFLAFAIFFALSWAYFNTRHLWWTWLAVARGDRPLAPAVAFRQRALPRLIRPIAVLWWITHFLSGVGFAHMMTEMKRPDGTNHSAGEMIFFAFVAIAITYAANGYLLMAVASITPRGEWINRVWSWRVRIDFLLVALSFLAVVVRQI